MKNDDSDFTATLDLEQDEVDEILARIEEQIEKQKQKLYQVRVQGFYFVLAKDDSEVAQILSESGFGPLNEYEIVTIKPANAADVPARKLREVVLGTNMSLGEYLDEKQ